MKIKISSNWRKEIRTLPNLLSIVRILLIPLYFYFVFFSTSLNHFYYAGLVIIVSGVTDFLDGQIARKYHLITELGIFLDPFADKLTQLALVISMAFFYAHIWWLLLLFLVKEIGMAVAGAVGLSRGVKFEGAKWYGKVATAGIYFGMIGLLVFPNLPESVRLIILLVITYLMVQAFVLYGRDYYQLLKNAS